MQELSMQELVAVTGGVKAIDTSAVPDTPPKDPGDRN